MPVLTLLTVDRFIAIVIPLRYKAIMKPAHCKTLVVFSWALLIIGLVNDTVSLSTGSKVCSKPEYNVKHLHFVASFDKPISTKCKISSQTHFQVFLWPARFARKEFVALS